jgi:hypothetical protein
VPFAVGISFPSAFGFPDQRSLQQNLFIYAAHETLHAAAICRVFIAYLSEEIVPNSKSHFSRFSVEPNDFYFSQTSIREPLNSSFKLPLPQEGQIVLLPCEPVQACYYGEKLVDSSHDIYLKIIDFTARYYSFESMLDTLFGIMRDILNCSAVIEKYFIFLDLFRRTKDALLGNLIATDLEFFFGNIRSLYDSLQTMAKNLWRITSGKNLPEDFYDMVRLGEAELKRKYGLPEPLLKFYMDTEDFFLKCRRIRTGFHHYRIDVEAIFCLEDGFALQKNDQRSKDPITSQFEIWPTDKIKENGLVSILALISYINMRMLEHTESFSEALFQSVKREPLISRNYKVYLRGPYVNHLLQSGEYLNRHWIPMQNCVHDMTTRFAI